MSPRVAHGEAESQKSELESRDGPVPFTTKPTRMSDIRRNDVHGFRATQGTMVESHDVHEQERQAAYKGIGTPLA